MNCSLWGLRRCCQAFKRHQCMDAACGELGRQRARAGAPPAPALRSLGVTALYLTQSFGVIVTPWMCRLAKVRSRSVKPAPGSAEEAVMLWLLATPNVGTDMKVCPNPASGLR